MKCFPPHVFSRALGLWPQVEVDIIETRSAYDPAGAAEASLRLVLARETAEDSTVEIVGIEGVERPRAGS